MAGGLIQVASYGSQDLTLTGNPQITFFKIVFRRYTNFGIRTIEVPFDNIVNFGTYSTLTVPKTGDLMTKTTLKIKLPTLDLKELDTSILTNYNTNIIDKETLEKYYLYYDFIINFINKLKNIVNTYFSDKNYNLNPITYIEDLKNYILLFIKEDEYLQFFKFTNTFLFNDTNIDENFTNDDYSNTFTNASLFKISNQILIYIYENYNVNEYPFDMFKFTILENMKILDELNIIVYKKLLSNLNNTNSISIGWIKKVAIFLIENVEMFIGSNLITRMSPNFIDTFGQVNYKNVKIYSQLIGNNINNNKSFLNNNKDNYLYLPLPFWFQNNYGLSVPLIATEFNPIQFKFKFRNLIELIYFELSGSLITNENIKNEIINLILSKTINIFISQLEITMLIEYVYLDKIERIKFAQSSHEYLITQVQELSFSNVSPFINNFDLNFFHCCKNMFWSAVQYKNINNLQKENNFSNYSVLVYSPYYNNSNPYYVDFIKMLYNSYTKFNLATFIEGLYNINISPKNNEFFLQDVQNALIEVLNYKPRVISPFLSSTIKLNGVVLISENFSYFNYLQPYNYYKNTPDLGINVYSFSLNPTESQPTGSCNFSRIPKISINFELYNDDNNLINITNNNDFVDNLSNVDLNNYKIFIQAENYNVIRFIGGVVGIAFTY
jgi:hypothetical protein